MSNTYSRYKSSLVLARLCNIMAQFGYKYPFAATTFMFGNQEKLISELKTYKNDPMMFSSAIRMLEETFGTNMIGLNDNEQDEIILNVLMEYYPTEYNNLSDVLANVNSAIVIK